MTAVGAVVRAAEARTERTETGANVKLLLDTGRGEPGLVRRMVEIPAQCSFAGTAGAGGELWFVVSGTASLDVEGEPGPSLSKDRGLWIPAGAAYQVGAHEADLRLDTVSLPAATSDGASESDPAADRCTPRSSNLADCDVETTGDRKFYVLFGPGRGCSEATQFVGEIPPGRAPDHSHPYDELVLILAGDGVAHIGGAQHALAPGTCLHLPPGLMHCLENTGAELLRVLGVFHPADSPAAKLQGHG
ncbi:MAG TPA: cupin domain-containing protein [Streptosporangiaceae bacterium]|nr:cupin domain-containing protein [Streptosporangiaceae bacterium]